MTCAGNDCLAYAKDGSVLYPVSRDQLFDHDIISDSKRASEQWLSCQQGNDLLSTFERFDKCRGVTIGLPAAKLDNVEVLLPPLRL